MKEADVLVVGAGPAGIAASLILARAGKRVLLAEQSSLPQKKACGEGVMPAGVALLDELGLGAQLRARGRPFGGVRFHDPAGRFAEGSFPAGRTGIALPRECLSAILAEAARGEPGIELVENLRATEPLMERGRLQGFRFGLDLELRAPWTVIADGARSPLAQALGVGRRYPKRSRFGLSTHYRGIAGLGERIEVFLRKDAEIYVAPQPEGTALVAVLLEEDARKRFTGRTREAFEETLAACPGLRARLRGAERIGKIRGRGPLGGRAARRAGPGWILAGDAAASVDPITGEGISLALADGRLAAKTILGGCADLGCAWHRARLHARTRVLAGFLLAAARRPALAGRVIAALAARPSWFDAILAGA